MKNSSYLVVMGVPSIKKYVFGTEKLKEIRGASALLDDLNNDSENFLSDELGASSKVEKVFLGGGAGQFIITAEKEKIEIAMNKMAGRFSTKTAGGVTLSWGMAEYTEKDYQKALQAAEAHSRIKTEETPFSPFSSLHTGFIRECDACSERPASPVCEKFDEDTRRKLKGERKLCTVCQTKIAYNYEEAKTGHWKSISDFLKAKNIRVERPADFGEIGDLCKAKKGYTALVYADGNAMGKLIKKIKTPKEFTFFSQTVEKAVRQACNKALHEILFENGAGSIPKTLPAEILMSGGDDLLVYLTAESAFPFAIKVAQKFNQISKDLINNDSSEGKKLNEKLQGNGLTISLGIVYAKSHSPFFILLEQAEELLKSAKQAGSADDRTSDYHSPTYIDYHLSSSYNQIHVKDCRLNHMEFKKPGRNPLVLHNKPYSLEDAKNLFDHAEKLKESGIPSTRLKRFGYAPNQRKVNSTLECLKLFTRTKKGGQRSAVMLALSDFGCYENIPWNEEGQADVTMLVDLIELTEFCK